MEIIKEDGGVTFFHFEFTEWVSTVENSDNPIIVEENWLLANSTYVIDLAFFLGGIPEKLDTYVSGNLPWHHNGAIYAGAGKTTTGALFSYQTNWKTSGRWAIEILTCRHRLYFKPLEKLFMQKHNSII